jgi:hypothetical protein
MQLKSFSILQLLLLTTIVGVLIGWYVDRRSLLSNQQHREYVSFQSGIQLGRYSSAKAINRFIETDANPLLNLQEYADSELVHLVLASSNLLRTSTDQETAELAYDICKRSLAELGCKSEADARELFVARVRSDNSSEDFTIYPELFDATSEGYRQLSRLFSVTVQGHTLNTPNQAGETTNDPGKPDE